jgi:hypothetical protein
MYLIPDTCAGWGASPRDGAPTFPPCRMVWRSACAPPRQGDRVSVPEACRGSRSCRDGALLAGWSPHGWSSSYDPGQLTRIVEDGQELPILALCRGPVVRRVHAAVSTAAGTRASTRPLPGCCSRTARTPGGQRWADLPQLLAGVAADPQTPRGVRRAHRRVRLPPSGRRSSGPPGQRHPHGCGAIPWGDPLPGQIQEALLQPGPEDAVRVLPGMPGPTQGWFSPGTMPGHPAGLPAWPIWLAGTAAGRTSKRRSLYRSITARRVAT